MDIGYGEDRERSVRMIVSHSSASSSTRHVREQGDRTTGERERWLWFLRREHSTQLCEAVSKFTFDFLTSVLGATTSSSSLFFPGMAGLAIANRPGIIFLISSTYHCSKEKGVNSEENIDLKVDHKESTEIKSNRNCGRKYNRGIRKVCIVQKS